MMFMTAFAGSTIFTTYSIYYVTVLELRPFELLLIGTVLEITVLVFEGITGAVADLYSRRLSVVIGMTVMGCGFLLEGSIIWFTGQGPAVPAVVWVMAAQLLFGLGWTFVSGADTAWIMDELGKEKAGSIFMKAEKASLAASLLGAGTSVGLSLAAPNLPYLAGGAVYLLLGAGLVFLMKETGFVRQERAAGSPLKAWARTWHSGASIIAGSPLLLMLVVVSLFGGAASEGYDRLWQIHLIEGIGFPDGFVPMAVWFGIISALSTLLAIPAVHIAERRIDMQKEKLLTAVLMVLTMVRIGAVLLLALAPGFYTALAAVLLLAVADAVSGPVHKTWLNMHLGSSTRATVLSMISQADALGQTAGGPAVGYIGSRFSIRASLLAAALLLLPVAGLFGRLLRRR
ncbi:MFS transporter [Paenibacillus sp. FSL R7-0273]|nr:MFS transporter [Paenibacillus sp. FSL R7-0273]OMF92832.1 MFS transporter [Paenibacillus sp. FSL R7-0273]